MRSGNTAGPILPIRNRQLNAALHRIAITQIRLHDRRHRPAALMEIASELAIGENVWVVRGSWQSLVRRRRADVSA